MSRAERAPAEPSVQGAAEPEAVRLTVASYNIHKCVGVDGRRDVDRVAEVLRELDADIVGLQEVDSHSAGFRDSRQLDYLASMTGYEAVPGFTIRTGRRHYGNALLSRYPVRGSRMLDLSLPRHEPRGAIDARVNVVGRELRVLVTHLGLRWGERRRQTRALLSRIQAARTPVVLLGDLNEWIPWFGALGGFARHFGHGTSPATFPVRMPLFPLDRIYCAPCSALAAVRAHRSMLARCASDHLPIVAQLEI